VERVTLLSFTFKGLPLFLLAASSGIGVVLLAYLSVLFLRFLPRGNGWKEEMRNRKAIAYLRVHFFKAAFGGTLAHTNGVLEGFQDNGYQAILISSDKVSGWDQHQLSYLNHPPLLYRDFPEVQEVANNFKLILKGWRILRKHRPGLIYQRHQGFTFAGIVLARLLSVPLVIEFNSSDYYRAQRWKERTYRLSRLLRLTEELTLSKADLVVAVSAPLKRQVLNFNGIEPERVFVQPNGVNPIKFTPMVSGNEVRARLSIPCESIVVGFAGSLMPYMGIDVLIEAASEIERRRSRILNPSSEARDLHFLIIGDGGMRLGLEQRAESKNLKLTRIHFPGAVPFIEVEKYLAACDILVSPHNPPFDDKDFYWSPIKMFEYMAMGKAIIASRIGQMAEVLSDGEDGLLVAPGNVEALVDAIVRLMKDRDLRIRLGANARQKVTFQYTWRQNVKNVLEELGRVMETKKTARE
jgi:glycosyltransferase involved in cell wall biosynthesis